jgi:hypothetical protein
VKPNINSVEVHLHLSYNRHPVNGGLVDDGSLWPLLLPYQEDNFGIKGLIRIEKALPYNQFLDRSWMETNFHHAVYYSIRV